MNQAELLATLSELAGIVPEYVDNWQRTHRPSDATRRALLGAMGFDVASAAGLAAAIDECRLRPWRRLLEPVRVTGETDPWVRLVMADAEAGAELICRLRLEDGTKHDHPFQPARLPRLQWREVDGRPSSVWKLALPLQPPPGYHQLAIVRGGEVIASQSLIVAPGNCYLSAALERPGGLWGPAVQLYGLRSERNWGIGDFTDLRLLLEQWSGWGADIVGVNPLHALFPHNPEHASPYSPSSRLYLNLLYLDVEAIAEYRGCEAARALVGSAEFQLRLQAQRETELVDYAAVAALKLPVLELLYRHFREQHLQPGSEWAAQFRAFQEREGERLYHHTLFEALQEHFHQQDPEVWGWPVWPEPFRQPQAPEVQAFAAQHRERIEFFSYLQWQASLQLAAAGWRSMELGLGVGIYLDLAVSVDGGGAESWANQALYAIGVGVGAPPELHNQLGQDWGLPPLVPSRLFEAAYAPFIATLRHNMRHAGALRLDHVMGLMRQYWVPAGSPPAAGAYVAYPFADLLGILALESQRNQCVVIGEDLGTVPQEVRSALAAMQVLSYRVLIDAKTADGRLLPPADYPPQALAVLATHDMPTLSGYWEGRDILRRSELGLFATAEARHGQVIQRARERAELLLLLEQEGLLPEGVTVNSISLPAVSAAFAEAVYVLLARSPARLLMVQLEDLFGVADQVNIPATTTQHPNWRRKLPLHLESWASDPRPFSLSAALRRERPLQRPPLVPRQARVPTSTYRLQFSRDFTFPQATELIPYLARLGISHVYCSPYLRARSGSSHGYDIIDHNSLNPEIGTAEEFAVFCNSLKFHGMGQILDMVPNHMGVMGADNAWWLDVLEHGQASVFAAFFDIDWQPKKLELHGKVLLPILAQRYGMALEGGELKLEFDAGGGSFSVWYHQHRLPIDPGEYPRLLRHRFDLLAGLLGPDHPDYLELGSLITAFENLPSRQTGAREAILDRQRDAGLFKHRLLQLTAGSPEIAGMVQETVNDFNGRLGDPDSFQLLHRLLDAQAWRLADWHVASDEINYRRFFDINDLAALRMEDRRVFDMTHRFVFDLLADGRLDGLRIDHPDGLYDPAQYFARLQRRAGLDALEGDAALYVVVEKILARSEPLRDDWAVQGSTGYDFCNLLTRLLVDPRGERGLNRAYRRFIHEALDFSQLVYRGKRHTMEHAMASELNVLAGQLSRICESSPHTRDYTHNNLRLALIEVIAHFPVYRTYVRQGQVGSLDRRYVEWAVALAKKANRGLDVTIFDFIASVLLMESAAATDERACAAMTALAMNFQQVSSPVMAKGVEDTALYRYHRLISLNEVGGDPAHFAVPLHEFHAENAQRLAQWPHTMLNSSTHDSKRSEDVRMRINVLSEIPERWQQQSRRWKQINRHRKRRLEQGKAPSDNDEYLLYQTLLGTWPLQSMDAAGHEAYVARIERYMLKAVREAKQHTSWVNPVPEYEEALCHFIRRLLQSGENNLFLSEFLPFQREVARWGLFNALSQQLLKLTSPGVPDLFQGSELWEFNLVDPDNRRPVDFPRRQRLLAELERYTAVPQAELAGRVRQLLETLADGRARLYLIWRLLRIRLHWKTVYQEGAYVPLVVSGAAAEHLCAFARSAGETSLISVAPRWYSRLAPGAGDLPLGPGVWGDSSIVLPERLAGEGGRNLLTGEPVEVVLQEGLAVLPVATLLQSFPVALVRL
ncbi:malto-oligosyltrehalose synthase [Sedimenticola hydrogenitrophicus]|uniref:malto-oligosyltrehalose synthase n=1 Tax=Sedimenticola hydrogenitrophicus TaxID=2967975 RepID=UPI0021A6FFE1|nr:malto-oligosyltrehalose synthase [Sedimenticola hydrogenitrophicus]